MRLVWALALFGLVSPASDQTQILRGYLRQPAGRPPVIETSGGKSYTVSGDQFTTAQMRDPKLKDREMELEGRYASPTHFEALKIYTLKDGRRYKVTYWCEICSIRTHMPGRCMCCQGETELQELPVE